jgi:hypothetical protein
VRCRPTVLLLLLIPAVLSPALLSQSSTDPDNYPRDRHPAAGQQTTPIEDETLAKQQKEMAKKANLERQVQLKRDTDKLFQLSAELKEYVDKTNPNILSLDVLKKAEEIEKLAHSVKTKMKGNN